MGTVGRTTFEGKVKDETLNMSRGRRPWATQGAEATGDPIQEGPGGGTACPAQHRVPNTRPCGTSGTLNMNYSCGGGGSR